MPYYRRRERKRRLRLWDDALRQTIGSVRTQIGLEPDELISDATLLQEARSQALDMNLRAAEQWFGWRLMGMANSTDEQAELAARFVRLPVLAPWGLSRGTDSPQRSRREAGRAANA